MKRLLLLIIVFSSIGIAKAQWHFSITSMSYNDNCVGDDLQGLSAYLEVEIRKQLATDYAAKTYSTKEECESARSAVTTNYSNSGCYIRITTSPCTGGNIGGGGIGGDGGAGIGGSSHGNASQHSSIAIGEPYFAPNEAQVISNTGRDLEIKLEALNKSFNSAINGIKTGDQSFDDIYRRQANALPKTKNENNGNIYTFNSRNEIDSEKPIYVNNINDQEQVNLEKENDYVYDKDAIIPNIDNTASPTDIEWNEGFEKRNDNDDKNEQDEPIVTIPNAPKLNDQSFPNANIENVQRYFDDSEPLADIFLRNPQKLDTYIETQFESVSGFNLEEIRRKQPNDRTEEEKQALVDYEAYRVKEMEQMNKDIEKYIDNSKEKKEIDAAILALDVYGDDEEGYINKTNYRKMDLEELASDAQNPLINLANVIKISNETCEDTGFHAELYYNEVTDTYVVSFAGSVDKEDWLYNNVPNLLGGDVPQYILAKNIGNAINNIPQTEREKLNIIAVGHSLGGGSASIVGLATGIETRTYNAARVPEGILKEFGLSDKVNNGDVENIKRYHTSTDPLTTLQESIGTPAIGISKDIGDPLTLLEKTKAAASAAGTGAAAGIKAGVGTAYAGAVVGATTSVIGEGHRMPHMTKSIINSMKKSEWDYIHDAQDQLKKELRSAEIKYDLKLNY